MSDNSGLFATTNKSLLLPATVNEVTRLPGPWLCHKCLRNIVGSQMVNVSVYNFVNVNVDIDVNGYQALSQVSEEKYWFGHQEDNFDVFYCRSLSLKVSKPPFKGSVSYFFLFHHWLCWA